MPELPEVESLRRSLLPFIQEAKIVSVEVLLPKLVSSKGTTRKADLPKVTIFQKSLVNQQIIDIQRRAKNLILILENGSLVLIHLKMTGQLVFKPKLEEVSAKLVSGGHPIELSQSTLPNKHTYVIFELDRGTLFYNDIRQFGYLLFYPDFKALEADKHFENLGLEPLEKDFTIENFTSRLKKASGNLKKVFLEQTVVVGLGNIYSDEVCFAAKIKPTHLVKDLKPGEISALYEAILDILPKAIKLGGSSIANYLLADGSRGNYAREHKVYNRGGQPCLVCGTILTKTTITGRTTAYCEHCQK